jgi:hypothetical protein
MEKSLCWSLVAVVAGITLTVSITTSNAAYRTPLHKQFIDIQIAHSGKLQPVNPRYIRPAGQVPPTPKNIRPENGRTR